MSRTKGEAHSSTDALIGRMSRQSVKLKIDFRKLKEAHQLCLKEGSILSFEQWAQEIVNDIACELIDKDNQGAGS